MAASYQELFVEKGASYNMTITIDTTNSLPMDLDNYNVKSYIKKSYYSSNNTAEFVVSMAEANTGKVSLTLSPQVTSNIAPGRYVYDVLMKDSSNNVTRVLEGIVNVSPQVTGF